MNSFLSNKNISISLCSLIFFSATGASAMKYKFDKARQKGYHERTGVYHQMEIDIVEPKAAMAQDVFQQHVFPEASFEVVYKELSEPHFMEVGVIEQGIAPEQHFPQQQVFPEIAQEGIEDHFLRGEQLRERGGFREAQECYLKVVGSADSLPYNYLTACYWLGDFNRIGEGGIEQDVESSNEYYETIVDYPNASRIAPKAYVWANIWLGHHYVGESRYEQAKPYYENVMKVAASECVCPDKSAYLWACEGFGVIYRETGDLAESERWYTAVIKFPNAQQVFIEAFVWAHCGLGKTYVAQKRYMKAMPHFNIASSPEFENACEDAYEEAIECINAASEKMRPA